MGAMMDADLYREQGYLLCRDFFPAEEVKVIHDEAKAVFEAQMRRFDILPEGEADDRAFTQGMFRLFETDLATFSNCGKQAQHLISLHRLSLDQRIVDALAELGLDFPNVSTRPVLYFNHPKLAQKEVYWRLSLHQDWRSMQGSLDSVVVWLPLIDIGRELGALEILPGSHKKGLLAADLIDGYGHINEKAARDIDPDDLISVEVKRGDALFFSTFLLHQSGQDMGEAIRWSCHFRYNNLAEPTFVERGYPHPYIYRPAEPLITEGFPTREAVDRLFGPDPA
jgi:ectoine hydroxylase-related dioxygenase (phytanoyl-CoA dioxygenase family)